MAILDRVNREGVDGAHLVERVRRGERVLGTVDDVMRITLWSRSTIYAKAATGTLPTIRTPGGRGLRFHLPLLLDSLEREARASMSRPTITSTTRETVPDDHGRQDGAVTTTRTRRSTSKTTGPRGNGSRSVALRRDEPSEEASRVTQDSRFVRVGEQSQPGPATWFDADDVS